MNKGKSLTASNRDRPVRFGTNGELLVPIDKKIVPNPDGTTMTELSLGTKFLPVPERRYHATIANVELDGELVRFSFGQTRVGTTTPRSLITVSVFAEGVRRFIASCKEFDPSLQNFLERNDIKRPTLTAVTDEPDQTVSFVANVIIASFTNREAELDVYQLSPSAIRRLSNDDNVVSIDQIVRVDLATSLLGAILLGLKGLEDRIPPEAK